VRVLALHNEYQHASGEDVVFQSETQLLVAHGLEVRAVTRKNQELASYGLAGKLRVWKDSQSSAQAAEEVGRMVREFAPDIVHVHNFMPLWSPSIFSAARQLGAATVFTLHNYRMFCIGGVAFRDGHPCHDCLGRPPWRGVLHRCYRRSFAASSAVAAMLVRNRDTWLNEVDAYIALTENSRQKFIAAGLWKDKIHVKPNFAPDPIPDGEVPKSGDHALYVGRLSEVKGVRVMVEAWKGLNSRLSVLGTGPLEEELRRATPPSIEFHGWVPPEQVRAGLREARFLIVPSVWPEPFGLVILEAFAMGRPVLGSRQGAIGELVRDGETGLLFEPGDADDLRAKARLLLENADLAQRLGQAARLEYLRRYTPEVAFHELMKVYCRAIAQRHALAAASVIMVGPCV
jgi:glycosyltransferase involved in cell wall biosynthesis